MPSGLPESLHQFGGKMTNQGQLAPVLRQSKNRFPWRLFFALIAFPNSDPEANERYKRAMREAVLLTQRVKVAVIAFITWSPLRLMPTSVRYNLLKKAIHSRYEMPS